MAFVLNRHLSLRNVDASTSNSNLREVEFELWNSFRSGNREALNVIFEKYVRLLYVYGRNITPDQGLISDCIQDIFVDLWVKRETITPQINSIKYYLFRSVRRRILRRLSTDKRIVGQSIPEDYWAEADFNIEVNLISDQASNDLSLQLKSSIAALSKAQREAIYLKFYENLKYEEIASVMNTDLKAVYNLINRSITSLRKFFKTHPIDIG